MAKIEEVNQKFEDSVKTLAAVMNTPHLGEQNAIENSEITGLVDEILKEEKNALKEEVKKGIKSALTGFRELEKEIQKKRNELTQLEITKKEEFINTINKLSKKIQDVQELRTSFAKGLTDPLKEA